MICFDKRKLWWILPLMLMALMLVCGILLNDIPERDVAHRYIPMAEAFAEGDLPFAFHCRIQPLQIICGGVIAFLTGFDAFTALKTASALWFIAGGAVLFFMLREIYHDRRWIAAAATVFYALHPYSFHFAISGLRESAKGTILLLLAWGLIKTVRRPERKSGFLLLGSAAALGIICRVDLILLGLIFFTIGTALEWRQKKFPLNSLYASVLPFLMLSGNSLINGIVPGAMLPDTRMVEYFGKIFNRMPGFADALWVSLLAIILVFIAAYFLKTAMKFIPFAGGIAIIAAVPLISSAVTALTVPAPDAGAFLKELYRGFYHFAGAFEIATIITLAIRKKLSAAEKILVAALLLNAAVNILSMQISHRMLFITSRYLSPALPLWSAFFIIGIKMIYDLVGRYTWQWLTNTLLVLSCTAIAGGLIYHMIQPVLRERFHRKHQETRQAALEIAAFIAKDYRGKKEHRVKQHIYNYQSKKFPKIHFTDSTAVSSCTALAGGSIANLKRNAHYIVGTTPPPEARIIMQTNGKYKRFYIWRNKRW